MAPRSAVPPVDQLIPPRPTGGLTFRQPEEPADLPSPSDLPTLSPDQSSPWDGDDSLSDEEMGLPPDDGPSGASRTSSRASSGSALSKKALREGLRTAVLSAGAAAGEYLTDDAGRAVELWVTDEGDAAAIGDPLASILNRRGGLGDAGNPDLGDAIAAAIGLGVYAWKQLNRWGAARRVRAQQRIAQQQAAAADGAGEPDQR
jgi:hypothetical protein